MKYLLGNLFAFAATSGLLLWPVWGLLEAHFAVKLAMSAIVVVGAAFFIERVLSKWINKLVAKYFPDSK